MKRCFLIALLLALAATAAGAQQDKTSKPFVVIVGNVVALSWNASTSSNIDHYNVYSSATSGTGYVQLGSSKTLTFTDLTTISGNTYFYVVTAVDSVGDESVYSNEAVAVVP